MQYLYPAVITTARLISSTIAEADYAAWAAATAYAVGDRAIRTGTHRIYERLIAGTTSTAPESDVVNWVDVGPTNRWAMFDTSLATASADTTSISMSVNAGLTVTGVVLLGLVASQVQIFAGATLVRTVAVPAPVAPSLSSTVMITGLSIAVGTNTVVTLTGTGALQLAHLSIGQWQDGGETLDVEVGITDFSTKSADGSDISKGSYSRKLRGTVSVPAANVTAVRDRLERMRGGALCYWSLDDGYESAQAFGWLGEFNFSDVRPLGRARYSVSIEGLARDDVVIPPGGTVAGFIAPVLGLAADVLAGAILIRWNEASGYTTEIRSGATWDTGALVFAGGGSSFIWLGQGLGTYSIMARYVDRSGATSATATTTISVTISGADAPVVTASIAGPDELITWTVPASTLAIDSYEVRHGANFVTGTSLGTVKGTVLRRRADYAGARTYWVSAIDSAGNYGIAGSDTNTIDIPGSVGGRRAEVVDNNALLFWTRPTTGSLPIADYNVKKGVSYASGTDLGSNAISTFTSVFEQSSGTYSYWIAAIDTAGNEGPAASIVATISQPPDFVLRTNTDSTFTGTRTNLTPYQGDLIGPVNTTETWSQHYTNNAYTTPQAQVTAGNAGYLAPSLTTATYDENWDAGVVLPPTVITVALTTTAVAGSVASSVQIYTRVLATDAWTAAAAGTSVLVAAFRYYRVVVSLTAAAGNNLLRINNLNVKLAAKLRTDSGTGTVTNATTGVVVPFSVPFLDADTPIVQPQGAVPLVPVVTFTDVANPTNFTVQLYTLAGALTTGSFSWTARGY